MTMLDKFIEYRALAFKFRDMETSQMIIDGSLAKSEETPNCDIPMRNVCAMLTLPLVEKLESTLQVLGMSKRRFVEMAIIDALQRIDETFERLQVFNDDDHVAPTKEGGKS